MNIVLAAANGGIGYALGDCLAERGHRLFSISRGESPVWSEGHLAVDLSDQVNTETAQLWLKNLSQQPELVIQCAGILHAEGKRPEKTLMQITESWLHENLSANLIAHVHLAQAVNQFVSKRQPLKWISLSAMVGSISDNQLGGWHSYRMSKAALNMFVRNLHIEWQRKSPESIAVALHPGTTESELSRPFQANIRPDKLYTKQLTAKRLSDVIENLTSEKSGKLLHWDGSEIDF